MFLTTEYLDRMQEALGQDLLAFLPELIACGGIVLLLVLRLFSSLDRLHMGWVALIVTFFAQVAAWSQWQVAAGSQWQVTYTQGPMFGGLLAYDDFTVFVRILLYFFAFLVICLSMLTGVPDTEESADFNCLLLGATVGMVLMAAANHLLMIFISVEMASLPSYALAGFLKRQRQSSEAALKYVVYGGGAAGIMLYGISLIAGKFGTGYLPDLAKVIPEAAAVAGVDSVLLLGMLFILVGIAFKLAAVPFHFWCPDVFEGAAAEVAGFLSVASKAGALALLARLTLTLVGTEPLTRGAGLTHYLVPALAFFAALTATFGNLAAYPQTNLKRLLAYSTIAHAGIMMMALATLREEGARAVLFYLVVYLFMNLGAFAVVAFLRDQIGSEDLADMRGLVRRSPVLVVTLGVFLLSLLGMPPLGGFAAKLQVFAALYRSGEFYSRAVQPGLAATMYVLLVIGLLNTVISLVYYVRVLKVMVLEEPDARTAPAGGEQFGASFYAALLAGFVLLLGVGFDKLLAASAKGADRFYQVSAIRSTPLYRPAPLTDAEEVQP